MLLDFTNGKAKLDGLPTCKKVAFRSSGTGDIFWGWEEATDVSGGTQGFPLHPNEGLILDGPNLGRPIFFATSDASPQLNYTLDT